MLDADVGTGIRNGADGKMISAVPIARGSKAWDSKSWDSMVKYDSQIPNLTKRNGKLIQAEDIPTPEEEGRKNMIALCIQYQTQAKASVINHR